MSRKGNEATAQGQAGAAPAPRDQEGCVAGLLSVGAGLEGEFAIWPDEAFLVSPDVKTAHSMGS